MRATRELERDWPIESFDELKALRKRGETDAANELRNAIFDHYRARIEPFVRLECRTVAGDAISEAHYAVLKAIDRFEAGKSATFWTYAKVCIRLAVLHFHSEEWRLKRDHDELTDEFAGPSGHALCRPEVSPDAIAGDLFGRAVLLAVLPLDMRVSVLDWLLTGEWKRPEGAWGAVERVWNEQAWPRWLFDGEGKPEAIAARLFAELSD